jgi:hypothetical protein
MLRARALSRRLRGTPSIERAACKLEELKPAPADAAFGQNETARNSKGLPPVPVGSSTIGT